MEYSTSCRRGGHTGCWIRRVSSHRQLVFHAVRDSNTYLVYRRSRGGIRHSLRPGVGPHESMGQIISNCCTTTLLAFGYGGSALKCTLTVIPVIPNGSWQR